MKNMWKALMVLALVLMMAASVEAKTVARENVGKYTISVSQQKGRTTVKWNGKRICSFRFDGKVKIIAERKFTERKRINRKGKILYIERTVGTVIDNSGNGRTSDGGYISYRKLRGKIHKGDVVVTYCVYNPFTHWIDDVTERYDAILY